MPKNRALNLILLIIMAISSYPSAAQTGKEEPRSRILLETTMGNMVIELYNETPLHRDNMLKLADEGFFNKQLFHRVIKDFMIQGGDPHSVQAARGQRLGTGGPGYTVAPEFNPSLVHKKGALAAARQGDQVNPEKRSSGSQFYIVHGRVFTQAELDMLSGRGMGLFTEEVAGIYTSIGGTPHLDGSYTVFGEVVEGLEVIDRIATLSTDANDRPLEDVVYSISVLR